jgi:hypothetical protein
VGICYENLRYVRVRHLYQASADLVLQPAAAGRPKPLIPGDLDRFDRMVRGIARHYARVLGVPVVMADQAGPLRTPLPGGVGELTSSFPGMSTIVDSDGTVKAVLGEEGVIVASVVLDPGPYTDHAAAAIPASVGCMGPVVRVYLATDAAPGRARLRAQCPAQGARDDSQSHGIDGAAAFPGTGRRSCLCPRSFLKHSATRPRRTARMRPVPRSNNMPQQC